MLKAARLLLLWAAVAAGWQAAQAQSPVPEKGRQYLELPASLALPAANTVPVLEFFWYACPNCYALEPRLERWVASLPPDVAFNRMPAVPNAVWSTAAQVYFALDAIGEEKRLHRALFDAIHRDGLRLTDDEALRAWLAGHGVDTQRYAAANASFDVRTLLERAVQMTGDYEITTLGVPTMVVGRYITNADMTGNPTAMLNVVDYLIGLTRSEQHRP